MFNQKSRIKNLTLSSAFGVFEQLSVYILSFVYRTVFLLVLSKEYLGISGLFTNILQVFSLTELGVGSVIAYRLYKPIKESDIEMCHALMHFYKNIYRVIAVIVFLMGCMFYPFLDSIIADTNEIPKDVNIYVVYWLYVLQSVVSYLFVYTQSLLSADQKSYIVSFANSLYNMLSTIGKILVLVVFKSFIGSLIIGIFASIFYNFLFAYIVKRSYRDVFQGDLLLNRLQKIEIFKDTGSLMCHKIGYVVLNSTDSIILSKYIGMAVLGVYSNYSMIATALDAILNKMLGSFVSTIGNLCLDENKENIYKVYKDLLFINFWLVSFCTVCFFSLVNSFVTIWLDDSYMLNIDVVIIISVNMFFNSAGIINSVFINANGLFVKDRIRPVIQAVVNLVVSVYLVKKMGIAGVFIGTLVSNILTTWWRQPLIVFKCVFGKNPLYFFYNFFKWTILTCFACWIYNSFFDVKQITFVRFILYVAICVIVTNLFYCILFRKNGAFIYCKNLLYSKIKK